eukprot:3558449-Pyramimonas_sp.AAC.1
MVAGWAQIPLGTFPSANKGHKIWQANTNPQAMGATDLLASCTSHHRAQVMDKKLARGFLVSWEASREQLGGSLGASWGILGTP